MRRVQIHRDEYLDEASGAEARWWRSLCSPLNVARLAGDLDVARATADNRLPDLVRAYLAWPAHRADGIRPNLRAQTNYYFIDPLVARLAALKGRGRPPDLAGRPRPALTGPDRP